MTSRVQERPRLLVVDDDHDLCATLWDLLRDSGYRVQPSQVPLWVNAANAVLVTSDRESFGLAVLEALACDVPVLSTPVGIAPEVLRGIDGAYCGVFDPLRWRTTLAPLLEDEDPRVAGRTAAERYSADRMAARVLDAWRGLL